MIISKVMYNFMGVVQILEAAFRRRTIEFVAYASS